jgi:Fur family iron response transcriptional regulator
VSLATVYNTLQKKKKKELLNKITIDTDKVYFDTNTSSHHHFFSDKEKILLDIKSQDVKISSMPEAPKGKKIKKVELIIHLED